MIHSHIFEHDKQRRRKARIITSVILLCIILVFIISLQSGSFRLTWDQIIAVLSGNGTSKEMLVLFEFRLPRMVISLLIGIGLALSGLLLQASSRNPLADSGILGINAGAGFMVALYVSIFREPNQHIFFIPFLAFLGAGITAWIIYIFSYKKNYGLSTNRMLLIGIAMNAAISAGMLILTIRLDPNQYNFITNWMAGTIWATNWSFVIALLPWILILLPYIRYKATTLNAFMLGDELAISLGVNVDKERKIILCCAVALAGASVSVSGGISFVGLLAPHIARKLCGARHEYMLLTTSCIGALLVLSADTIARTLFAPNGLPTGVIVAVLGAPYFLYLLSNKKR